MITIIDQNYNEEEDANYFKAICTKCGTKFTFGLNERKTIEYWGTSETFIYCPKCNNLIPNNDWGWV